MKHLHFAKEHHGHPAAFSFRYIGTQGSKQRFDVLPGEVRADRMGPELLQRAFVAALHIDQMVPKIGTLYATQALYSDGVFEAGRACRQAARQV